MRLLAHLSQRMPKKEGICGRKVMLSRSGKYILSSRDGRRGHPGNKAGKSVLLIFSLIMVSALAGSFMPEGDRTQGDLTPFTGTDDIRYVGDILVNPATGEFVLEPGFIYKIEIAGGNGLTGDSNVRAPGTGGKGAVMICWIDMTAANAPATYTYSKVNGGIGGFTTGFQGGNGGAASVIKNNFNTTVLVAGGGGGGGAGGDNSGGVGGNGGNAGVGNAGTVYPGQNGIYCYDQPNSHGRGGTVTLGGIGGTTNQSSPGDPGAGANGGGIGNGMGGAGGNMSNTGGAGGGAGYTGGGGGASLNGNRGGGGGGGGSSYAAADSSTFRQGDNRIKNNADPANEWIIVKEYVNGCLITGKVTDIDPPNSPLRNAVISFTVDTGSAVSNRTIATKSDGSYRIVAPYGSDITINNVRTTGYRLVDPSGSLLVDASNNIITPPHYAIPARGAGPDIIEQNFLMKAYLFKISGQVYDKDALTGVDGVLLIYTIDGSYGPAVYSDVAGYYEIFGRADSVVSIITVTRTGYAPTAPIYPDLPLPYTRTMAYNYTNGIALEKTFCSVSGTVLDRVSRSPVLGGVIIDYTTATLGPGRVWANAFDGTYLIPDIPRGDAVTITNLTITGYQQYGLLPTFNNVVIDLSGMELFMDRVNAITVNIIPSGYGSVEVADPATGVPYGAVSAGGGTVYVSAAVERVTFTATSEAGNVFLFWHEVSPGSPDYIANRIWTDAVIDEDKTIEAMFAAAGDTFKLGLSSAVGGTASFSYDHGAGKVIGRFSEAYEDFYIPKTEPWIKLSGEPDDFYSFTGWRGSPGINGTMNNQLDHEMTGDTDARAMFVLSSSLYFLKLSAAAGGIAQVSYINASGGFLTGTAGTSPIDFPIPIATPNIVLTGIPVDPSYVFMGWSGTPGINGTANNSLSYTLTGNTTAEAMFELRSDTYSLLLSAGLGGSVQIEYIYGTLTLTGTTITDDGTPAEFFISRTAPDIALTSIPRTNYVFEEWISTYPDIYGTHSPLHYTMTADRDAEAEFLNYSDAYELILSAAAGGNATVTYTTTSGVSISEEAVWGDPPLVVMIPMVHPDIILTGMPDPAYSFIGWMGSADINGKMNNELPYKMNGHAEAGALFMLTEETYKLTLNADAGGTAQVGYQYGSISMTGTARTPAEFAIPVTAGGIILSGMPDPLYFFMGWLGSPDIGGHMENDLPYVMTGDAEATALFSDSTYVLTLYTNNAGGTAQVGYLFGTVTMTGAAGTAPTEFFIPTSASAITITGVSGPAHSFIGWVGSQGINGVMNNDLSIVLNSDATAVAMFELTADTYMLRLSAADGGTAQVGFLYGTVMMTGTARIIEVGFAIPTDSTITLTGVPDAAYSFIGWAGTPGIDGIMNNGLVHKLVSDAEAQAMFMLTADTYSLTLSATMGGTVTGFMYGSKAMSGTAGTTPVVFAIPADSEITLAAAPTSSGFVFVNWTGSRTEIDLIINPVLDFILYEDTWAAAHFDPSGGTHKLTLSAAVGGTAMVTYTTNGTTKTGTAGTTPAEFYIPMAAPGIDLIGVPDIDNDYAFIGWNGSPVIDGQMANFYAIYPMGGDIEAQAMFDDDVWSLHLSATLGGTARVTYLYGTKTMTTSAGVNGLRLAIPKGAEITLFGEAYLYPANYSFTWWAGSPGINGVMNIQIVQTMSGNTTAQANFALTSTIYKLTLSAGAGGTAKVGYISGSTMMTGTAGTSQEIFSIPMVTSGITLTGVPGAGHEFTNWESTVTELNGIMNNDHRHRMTADADAKAMFSSDTYKLTLSSDGSGTARVGYNMGSMIGTAGPAPVEFFIPRMSAVITLAGVPSAGYKFANWESTAPALNGIMNNNRTHTMDGDVDAIAKFSNDTWDLVLSAGAGGTAQVSYSADGNAMTGYVNKGTFDIFSIPKDTAVVLNAVPVNADHVFLYWESDDATVDGTANSVLGFVISADTAADAVFADAADAWKLELSSTAGGTAEFSYTTGGKTCTGYAGENSSVAFHILRGSLLTLTANENPGEFFKAWSGDITGTAKVIHNVAMDGDKSVTAEFTATSPVPPVKNYYITATSDEGSTISPGGQVTVKGGDSITFVYSASEGFTVTAIRVDGKLLSRDETDRGSYTFRSVNSNHTIEVSSRDTRTDIMLRIDVMAGEGYAEYKLDDGPFVRYTGPVLIPRHTGVTVAAYADEGYSFKEWKDGDKVYTMPNVDLGTPAGTVHLELYFKDGSEGPFEIFGFGLLWWMLMNISLLIIAAFLFWFLFFRRRTYEVIKVASLVEMTGKERVRRKRAYRFTIKGGYSGTVSYKVGEEGLWKVLVPNADGEYVIPKGEITDAVVIEARRS